MCSVVLFDREHLRIGTGKNTETFLNENMAGAL